MSAGGIHNCFIDDFGQTLCWGNPVDQAPGVPLGIEGLSRATQVSSSYDSACARTVGGGVECWGQRFEVGFRGLSDVKAVAAGSTFDCAIHQDETVSCWGSLEPGSTERYPPWKLALVEARAIAVGHYEGCVIDAAERVLCFGHGSASFKGEEYPAGHFHRGAQRDGSWVSTSEVRLQGVAKQQPVRGSAGAPFTRCHAPELLTQPELSGHAILKIEWGQAGQKLMELRGQTPRVTLIEQSFRDALGERMKACLLEQAQHVVSLPGVTGMRVEFAPLLARALAPRHILDGAIDIDLFGYIGCAVTREKELACWQSSYAFGTKEAHPEELGGSQVELVEGIENAVQVAVGLRHVCVRHEDGSVTCFGDEEALGGVAQTVDEFGLSRLNLKRPARHLVAGAVHTCAATDPPQIACWGYGGRGGIGRGATDHRAYDPAPVSGLPLPERW